MKTNRYGGNFNKINPNFLERSQNGKWNDWERIYIIKYKSSKYDAAYAVAYLNFFNRIARLILEIFKVDYFANELKTTHAHVMTSSELTELQQKMVEQRQKLTTKPTKPIRKSTLSS